MTSDHYCRRLSSQGVLRTVEIGDVVVRSHLEGFSKFGIFVQKTLCDVSDCRHHRDPDPKGSVTKHKGHTGGPETYISSDRVTCRRLGRRTLDQVSLT